MASKPEETPQKEEMPKEGPETLPDNLQYFSPNPGAGD